MPGFVAPDLLPRPTGSEMPGAAAPLEHRHADRIPGFQGSVAHPGVFALAVPDPKTHVRLSENRNPGLRWRDVPGGTRTLVLLCVDPDRAHAAR